MSATVRIELPYGLRKLACLDGQVLVSVPGIATQSSVLDTLEQRYPVLRGTIRDHGSKRRRPFIRFFACQQDLSNTPPDEPLPEAVCRGEEPFLVVGAIAGG